MKKVYLGVNLISFIIFCGLQGSAQEFVTLSEALNYAMENNTVIRQAELDIENARQQVKESKSSVYPQVSVMSSLTGNPIVQQFVLPAESFGGAPGEFMSMKVGQNWGAMSQLLVRQQVYNQQIFSGLKAAKSGVELYQLIQEVAIENIIQIVAANFYQVLISDKKIAVIDANINQLETIETMMKGQLDVGLVRAVDVDRIKVSINSLKTQRQALLNAITQQTNMLKYYMGMPIQEEISLVNPIDKDIVIPPVVEKTDESILKNLYAYQVLEKQGELFSIQKKIQEAEAYPSLSLDGSYTYNSQSDNFNLYSKKALNYDMSGVNLTLSIPIFDGFARRSRLNQTEIAVRKLQEDKRGTINELTMNIENAKAQMHISYEIIQDQISNVELAEKVFNSTQNNYQNGLSPLTDLLDAETGLLSAKNDYQEAILNYKIAEIEYLKSKGNIKSLLND